MSKHNLTHCLFPAKTFPELPFGGIFFPGWWWRNWSWRPRAWGLLQYRRTLGPLAGKRSLGEAAAKSTLVVMVGVIPMSRCELSKNLGRVPVPWNNRLKSLCFDRFEIPSNLFFFEAKTLVSREGNLLFFLVEVLEIFFWQHETRVVSGALSAGDP